MTDDLDTIPAFDPIHAFQQAMNDLVHLTGNFQKDETAITAAEFLQGITSIGERVRAIALVTLTGAMTVCAHKIPAEVREQHEAKRDFDSLMSTPDDERKRLLKAIKSITLY